MSVISALVYRRFFFVCSCLAFFFILHKNDYWTGFSNSHGHLLHISGIPFHIFHISYFIWTRIWLEKCLWFAQRSQMELEHYDVATKHPKSTINFGRESDSKKSKSFYPKADSHKLINVFGLLIFVSFRLFFSRSFILFYLLLFVCTYNSYLTGAHISLICWALCLSVYIGANADFPFSFSIL